MHRISLVIALVILSGSTVDAATTDVEILDPALQPYQVSNSTSCAGEGDCALVFPEITTANTLVLHTSCIISLTTGGQIGYAQLGIQQANGSNQLPLYGLGSANGVMNFATNAQTYLFYNKGQRPRVDVFGLGSAVQFLSCTLSGHNY